MSYAQRKRGRGDPYRQSQHQSQQQQHREASPGPTPSTDIERKRVPMDRSNWITDRLIVSAAPTSRAEFLDFLAVVRPRVIARIMPDEAVLHGVYKYWTIETEYISRQGIQLLGLAMPRGGMASDGEIEAFVRDIIRASSGRPEDTIWLHCITGVGRTGVVAATYLGFVHHWDSEHALDVVGRAYERRIRKPAKEKNSPDTEAQRAVVRRILAPSIPPVPIAVSSSSLHPINGPKCGASLTFRQIDYTCELDAKHIDDGSAHRAELRDAERVGGVFAGWSSTPVVPRCSWGDVATCDTFSVYRAGDSHRVVYMCPRFRCECDKDEPLPSDESSSDDEATMPAIADAESTKTKRTRRTSTNHTASEVRITAGEIYKHIPDSTSDIRSAQERISWSTSV